MARQTSKKKIFLLITRAEAGGAQTHVMELMRGLRDRYELVLGTGEEGPLLDEAIALDIAHHHIPDLVRPIAPARDWRAYRAIRRILQETRPDLLHVHSSKAGILGRLAAWREGIPSVFTAHGWAFARGTTWRRKLVGLIPEFLLTRITDRIITVSDEDRELALRYCRVRSEQVITVHNGIAEIPVTDREQRRTAPRLIMIARFTPQKDFAGLIASLRECQHDYHAWLVGDGPLLADCQAQVQQLRLANRVEFLGTRDDVPELLQQADIFVLASNWEGFPISILEAMRAGLPVVASDVGGVREAVTDGINGYLVPRGDTGLFAERIDRLLMDSALRATMGQAGRERFLREFTREAMLEQITGIYSGLGALPQSIG